MFLATQRNDVFNILINKNIDPNLFEIQSLSDGDIKRIQLKNSNFWFQVMPSLWKYVYAAFPVVGAGSNKQFSSSSYTWDEILRHINSWAGIIKEEIETVDLWKELVNTTNTLSGNSSAPDEKFTNQEIRELESRLRLLEQKIADSDIPEAAKKSLTETVQAAPEKASFFTKKDWKDWIVGNIARQAVSLSLTQEHVNTIWALFKSTFSALFLN